jgi:3-oxoacyl-(acyl-carrier-protein) synthase
MELLRNGRPRVVITGLGAVTALGSVKTLWEGLKSGKSGIRHIETIPIEHVPVQIGGEVRDFDPNEYIDRKEARRMGRASNAWELLLVPRLVRMKWLNRAPLNTRHRAT